MKPMLVDYRLKVSMPVRDMEREGDIAFVVDVYGVTPRDIATVPGGSEPMFKAIKRMGLDPIRYQPLIWDVPVSRTK